MFRLISSLNQIHIERNFVIYKKIRFDKSNLQTSSKLLNSNLLLKFSRFFNISKWKAPKIPKIPPLESKKFIFETSSSKDPSQIKKMEWDDPFSWLQNLKDPRVLDYIKKENKYSSKILENFSNLSRELYEEMIKILPKEQRIPPIIHESYVYYAVSYENENFYRYNRREISLNPITNEEEKGEEEVLLDQNEEAKKYGYTDISILKISDDHKYLAYTMDITGNEIYCAFVKHLSSGKIDENVKLTMLKTLNDLLFFF